MRHLVDLFRNGLGAVDLVEELGDHRHACREVRRAPAYSYRENREFVVGVVSVVI